MNASSVCCHCGRPLTNALSVECGIGPICRVKIQAEREQGKDGRTMADLPFDPETGDVICQRLPSRDFRGHYYRSDERGCGRIMVNIDQAVVHHSPSGFEWGYGGSGPADLALNILNLFVPPGGDSRKPVKCYRGVCSYFAWRFHHEFKSQFVATLPVEGGSIPWTLIRTWIEEKQHELLRESFPFELHDDAPQGPTRDWDAGRGGAR